MAEKGYVLYDGPSPYNGEPIVGIATRRSANRKTGDMAQLWILHRDVAPHEAVASGADAAICGPCPLRGDGTGKGRACYVTLVQAPLTVWKTYRRNGYVDATRWDYYDDERGRGIADLFDGATVRLGAYGDPAMLPIGLVRAVVSLSKGWTGYTHQWQTVPPEWAGLLMASADSVAMRSAARARGYRSFYVVPAGQDVANVSGAMECAATRKRNPLQCSECLACGGTRNGAVANAVDVVIAAHGAGAKYVTA